MERLWLQVVWSLRSITPVITMPAIVNVEAVKMKNE